MRTKRTIIEIDENLCNGCGKCVPSCHEGAIQLIDGKARLVADVYCDGLGACIGECPTGALKVIEREADSFDEEAVKAHLARKTPPPPGFTGCPSAQVREMTRTPSVAVTEGAAGQSALASWPVQIRLVPPSAPFLQGADLAVTADCVPFAYAAYHQDFLAGKIALVGCPKLDDLEAYTAKFADIFSTANIRSVSVIVMQVPCCQGLPKAVVDARAIAGVRIPVDKVIVGIDGTLISRQSL